VRVRKGLAILQGNVEDRSEMVVANAYEAGARRVGQSTPYRERLNRFWEYSEEYFMEEIFLRFPQPLNGKLG